MAEVRKPETLEATVKDIVDRLRRVEAQASRAPSQSVGVELANQFTEVTSGSFVPTCHWNLPAAYSEVLNAWVVITTPAGTTGEVRLREFYSGAVSDTIAVPALSNNFYTWEWLHGVSLGGAICEFRVEARRTSGTGAVNVYSPRRFLLDSRIRFPAANTAGNPQVL